MRSTLTPILAAAGLSLALAAGAAAQPAQGKTHVGAKPAGLVDLFGNAFPGQTVALSVLEPDGSLGGAFELPPGTALVVTDLAAHLNAGGSPSGLTRGGLTGGPQQTTRPGFSFYGALEGGQTVHLTTGVLWTTTPMLRNAADSGDAVFVEVSGYLVKNK
jgi:hypothetical protein